MLFGKYNPAGRLPVTFYKSVKDLPPFEDYTMEGRTYKYFHGKSLFPFGFGLSYTKFDYLSGELSEKQARIGDTLMMSVKVKNTGNYDGDETVQLYVSEQADRAGKPIKSLKGFKRVHFKSGETKIVNIALPVCKLQTYDEITDGLSVKPGAYEIMCGASSDDIRLTQELVIKL